jgi:hypothetical protein
MERLDHGHLFPKLEVPGVPRLTFLSQEFEPGSTLAKSFSKNLLIAIRNIYMSLRQQNKFIPL